MTALRASLRSPSAAPRMRDAAIAVCPALLVLAAWVGVTAVALSTVTTGDYLTNGPVAGDNPGPAITALLHGNLSGLVSHQPWMGLTSIVLRAPFAGLASALGSGNLLAYRLGAFPCLVSLGALALWLAARRAPEIGRVPGLLAALALLVSPVAVDAIRAGHAEEVLAAVFMTAAVLAATRGRAGWAGVLLGLAVGTKPWAVIGTVPVLIATPGKRGQTAAIAAGLAAILGGSAPLADPEAFSRARHWVDGSVVNTVSLWWPLSTPIHLRAGGLAPARLLPFGLARSTATLLDFGIAALGSVLVWVRARRRGGSCDALALLALLGVVRCAGDPTTLEYYYLAILIPLAAWEAVGLGRAPIVTVAATAAVTLIFGGVAGAGGAVLSAASIAFTVILGAYLTHAAFRGRPPGRPATGWRPTTSVTEV